MAQITCPPSIGEGTIMVQVYKRDSSIKGRFPDQGWIFCLPLECIHSSASFGQSVIGSSVWRNVAVSALRRSRAIFSPAFFSVSRTASRVNLLHYAGLFQLLYNRQQNMSWVRTGVLNRLLGHSHLRTGPERFPRIGIAVELWKVTAGDVHANAMPLQKHVARGQHVDLELVGLARLQQFRPAEALAIARSHDPFRQINCPPVRIDIDELGDKVGIRSIRGGVQR